MTTIKFKAGETVYWLSNTGFTKGIIRRVYFCQDVRVNADKKMEKGRTELTYFLWSKKNHPEYQGDQIPESLVFKSYEEMVAHYMDESATITT